PDWRLLRSIIDFALHSDAYLLPSRIDRALHRTHKCGSVVLHSEALIKNPLKYCLIKRLLRPQRNIYQLHSGVIVKNQNSVNPLNPENPLNYIWQVNPIFNMPTQPTSRSHKQDVFEHPDFYGMDDLLTEEHKL